MHLTSKWTRHLIQAAPPPFKRWLGTYLPGLKQRLGDHAFNRIDHSALQRFAETHTRSAPVMRSLDDGLAVVVPCYNHASYLDTTICCLVQQTYRPFQVIFVEDHSTDDTWLRLQDLVAQFPNDIQVTLLRSDRNRGQAAALNLGIEQTKASIYTVLNDDDYLMHDALEAIVTILNHRTDLYLLGTGSRPFTGAGEPPGDDASKRIAQTHPQYMAIPLVDYTPLSVPLFKHPNDLNMTHSGTTFFRSAWQAVGGYYAEKAKRVVVFADRDFQLRVASLFPVAVSREVTFSYWRANSSVDSGKYS